MRCYFEMSLHTSSRWNKTWDWDDSLVINAFGLSEEQGRRKEGKGKGKGISRSVGPFQTNRQVSPFHLFYLSPVWMGLKPVRVGLGWHLCRGEEWRGEVRWGEDARVGWEEMDGYICRSGWFLSGILSWWFLSFWDLDMYMGCDLASWIGLKGSYLRFGREL